eukprot:3168363-Alexandrium_andersonii.AAC.1
MRCLAAGTAYRHRCHLQWSHAEAGADASLDLGDLGCIPALATGSFRQLPRWFWLRTAAPAAALLHR